MLLVTRPGYTEEGLLNEAAQQLIESEDVQFLGAVANDANLPIQLNERADMEVSSPVESSVEQEDPDRLKKMQIGS